MSNFMILNQNFADTEILNDYSISSASASYPEANVYNKYRRAKVWRSAGYWEIISGSNTIVFQETNAVNLTATIAAAEYSTTTTFLAAIKTALEAVGASTYTVAVDTATSQIKITSDGLGGGGIFKLMWTDPASADMAAVLGYDTSADDTGALTYLADELKINTSEWIKWDMGLSSNPKAFCLIGPKTNAIKLSPTATILLQGNETDIWDTPSFEQQLTYDERVITAFDSSGLHTEALRYWRLFIQDAGNVYGYLEAGFVYLGGAYSPTRGAAEFPLQLSYDDRSETVYSENGYSFGDTRNKTSRFQFDLFALTSSEKENLESLYDDMGKTNPFFIILDPNLAFGSSSNYNIRYVKFDKDLEISLISPNVFTARISLREEL